MNIKYLNSKCFHIIIISLFSIFSCAQNIDKDSIQLEELNLIYKQNVKEGKLTENIELIKKELLKEKYSERFIAKLHLMLSSTFGMKNEIDSAKNHIEKALFILEKIRLFNTTYYIGKQNLVNIYIRKGDFQNALVQINSVINYYRNNSKLEYLTALITKSTILHNIGMFEEADKVLEEAENIALEANDYDNLYRIYNEKALLEYKKGNKKKLDLPIKFSKVALEYATKTGKSLSINNAKSNYGSFLWHNKQFDDAIPILKEVDSFYILKNIRKQTVIFSLFKAYNETYNFDEAKKYYERIDKKEINDPSDILYINNFDRLYRDNKLINSDYYFKIKEILRIQDSINAASTDRMTIELEKKYQLSQKQNEIQALTNKSLLDQIKLKNISIENLAKEKQNIELLNQKKLDQVAINETNLLNKKKEAENQTLKAEKSLQKAKISSQNKMLLGGGIGLGVISLLSLLLYRQSRKRRLMNETLIMQKDKIQLLNRELNHRVKNNLAFMTSLLEMQGRRTESAETKQALIESESRLKALALVHSQLFRSDTDTEVNLKNYLEEIKEHLLGIFSIPDKELNIETDFCDYTINAEDAMRIGLIVNESVTNSVKHAFTEVENPEIRIKTSISSEGKLVLTYSDNGPGISKTVSDNIKETSLGIKLIDLLRKQLGDRYVVVV
jgi:two-component sensor histidine kinase